MACRLVGLSRSAYRRPLKGDTVVRPDNVLNGGSQVTQLFSGPVNDSTALAVNIEPANTSPQLPTSQVLGLAKI